MCVKHHYAPKEESKMDGQVQTQYVRKNWSSFMLFNNAHPANTFLNLTNVNSLPGRDLHRFSWLKDADIGELPVSWNWLEGHYPENMDIKAVHFTRGTPDMQGYENVPFAPLWNVYAERLKLCNPDC
jgi:hypothetical protein